MGMRGPLELPAPPRDAAMTRCTCRRCNPGPFGGFAAVLGASRTTDERVASACRSFVMSAPTWGSPGLTVEWLERELDELLGITHARYELAQLRAQLERRPLLARLVRP
jgi:hypothetical protein